LANGVFQGAIGEVKTSVGSEAPVDASVGGRFRPGTTVTTGPGSRAVLRFEDGHGVVLHENTEFRVIAYRFSRDRPQDDAIDLQLVKGALRSVSGLIGQRSRSRALLSVPQATIGLRGDFVVVLVNPAYLSVRRGAVEVTNAAGAVTFSAGALGTIAAATTLAEPVAASGLPAAVSAAFDSLGSVALGPAGSGGASVGATGAGAQQGGWATAAAVAASVAGILAAAGNSTAAASNH